MRHFRTILAALIGICTGTASPGHADESPQKLPPTLQLDGSALMKMRARAMAGDTALAAAIQVLRREADEKMHEPLLTVIDKKIAGPGGDKRDYVSLATYAWPNPKTPNGLPYIMKDGVTNPETEDYDNPRLKKMSEAVQTLALAWWFTGNEEYARRAASQLRAWFFDERTRMFPNLKHAQMIRGVNEGSSGGLIDTMRLPLMIDGEALLQGSKFWSEDDHRQLQKWFREYLDWFRTSVPGMQEAKQPNNHGTWYDAQEATFALFVDDKKLAREIIENAKTIRIARQIEPDGRQPAELARTRSLDYSLYNIQALGHLARLGDHVGVDLWNYRTSDGRGFRTALDWLLPFATGKNPWTYKQIVPRGGAHAMSYGVLIPILREAATACKNPAYEQAIPHLSGIANEIGRANLLYPPAGK